MHGNASSGFSFFTPNYALWELSPLNCAGVTKEVFSENVINQILQEQVEEFYT